VSAGGDGRPLLSIQELDAHYGRSHVLQGVSFEIGHEPVSLIGRNGMGKSTLCNAIMQIRPPTVRGSIRFEDRELVGLPSYKIAALGIGYVPQGRRLFQSLTVAEHLRMAAPRRREAKRRWTPERIYELFPRLAERKETGGTQLSGGEQQMLAIGRALLGNPKLLIMDEPSEGLAPTVIETLISTFRRLAGEGLSILVVEQNLAVATALAERQLVMVAGQIAGERSRCAAPLARRRTWLACQARLPHGSCSSGRWTPRATNTRFCASGSMTPARTRSWLTPACSVSPSSAPTSPGRKSPGPAEPIMSSWPGRAIAGGRSRRWAAARARFSGGCTPRAGCRERRRWVARVTRRSPPRRCAICPWGFRS